MTDRELLELAAKAAGIDGVFIELALSAPYGAIWTNGAYWNPLTDDGDALRLAVKLQINIRFEAWEVIAERFLIPDCKISEHLTMGYSIEEATRRAIVRAAASIGEQMK